MPRVDVRFEDETVWMSLQQIADLFQVSIAKVMECIQCIYQEGELSREVTSRIWTEGDREASGEITQYNLDMIISLSFRIRSAVATRYKLHFAAHGHTAAEVIYQRADAEQPFMGVTSFSGEIPALRDTEIAKNDLSETELKRLNNLVSGYFDLAEAAAMNHEPLTMKDHIDRLDRILSANGENLLEGSGSISHEDAVEKARSEYRKYQVKTVSPVEQAYLETISGLEKRVKRQGHG